MAKEWQTAADFPVQGYYDESGFIDTGGGDIRNGLLSPQNWHAVARQLGYQGPFEAQVYATHEGGYDMVPAPEFLQFIEQKKAEGYDFVIKNADKRTSIIGLMTPTGEVVAQREAKSAGFGEFFKEFVLPAFAAYGAVNFLGPRLEGLTNALSGGGQLSAAELANIPTGTMGQVSQPPALGAEGSGAMYTEVSMAPGTETGLFGEQFHPIKNYPYSDVTLNALAEPVASVTTPAAQLADAANAMQLSPVTQLQPITFTGEPYLTAGAGGGLNALTGIEALAGVSVDPAFAAGMGVDAGMAALAPAGGLSVEALDAALAGGAPIGATTGTAPLGGVGVPELTAPSTAGGGAALEALGGSLQAGTTPGALGSVIGSTGGGAAIAAGAAPTILDRAIDLVTSPVGQAVVGAVGSVAGGVMQANAAEAAANQQAEAARNALALQREMFEYQKGLLEPYRTAGTAALKRLEGALGLGGAAQAQQMLEMDPGYGFRLGEGMKALERMQAARGNMLSGGALKAGQQYAQNFASNEYDRAFGRLADIAGIGRSTATQQGTAAQQFGTSAGNVMGQEANALAAGRIGRGSAYSGAIQGGLNAFQNYFNRQQEEQLFRDIFGRTAVGG